MRCLLNLLNQCKLGSLSELCGFSVILIWKHSGFARFEYSGNAGF